MTSGLLQLPQVRGEKILPLIVVAFNVIDQGFVADSELDGTV
ncbi:hypothetical protein [cyanobacterium endosymbiont of Rhopalodia gibberula]|nr:hypothetical protein [cyanobacterium endosymbiont of Rhopalodia gibberula]